MAQGASPEELNARFQQELEPWNEREQSLGIELLTPTDITFVRKLGEGTSATVYLGIFKGQEVAIKVLKDNVDKKLWEDFKKELKVMNIVKGNRVVAFIGVCVRPNFSIVMEFCHQGTLLDVLKNQDMYWDWERAFNILMQTIEAVKFLHDFNPQIVHRDLKSLNLLVDKDFNVKVCDFGLSRQTEETQTQEGADSINTPSTLYKLRGTYGYSAPELYNKGKATTKADMFSLAVVLWEILYRVLCGEWIRPYSENKHFHADVQILIGVAKKGLRPTIPDNCPESLKLMLRNCWADDPVARPECMFLLNNLRSIQGREYKEGKAHWDSLLPPRPQTTTTTTTTTTIEKKKKKKKKTDGEGDGTKKKKKKKEKTEEGEDGEKKKKKKKKTPA